jgi:hypothetical protein
VGPAFVNAFQHALGWVAAVMGVIFLLMFALPGRATAGGGSDGQGGGFERELMSSKHADFGCLVRPTDLRRKKTD